jgi:hypothetical protein
MTEACRIGIHCTAPGVVDVGAPMKYKEVCYDMLRDARFVIERTGDEHFFPGVSTLTIVMDMSGRVDVGAPLPERHLAYLWLEKARDVIERFNDDSAPAMRPFNSAVMGGA